MIAWSCGHINQVDRSSCSLFGCSRELVPKIGESFWKNKFAALCLMTKLAGMSVPLFLIECRKPLFGDKYVVILFWIRKLFVIVVVFDVCALLTYREYLIGVRQRKNKKRKVADQQNKIKKRQRGLQVRQVVSSNLLFCFVYKGSEHCLAFVLRKYRHVKH